MIGNVWPEGGYDRWKQAKQGDDLPVWLEQAGYRNALLGKYFNEYPYHPGSHLSDPKKATLRSIVRRAGSRGPRRCRGTPTPRATTS